MSMDSLKDLYIDELKDLYSAETQLVKALPKMAKKASAPELKQAFQDHLEETKGHVARLEEIFEELDEKPTGKTCKAMKGSGRRGRGSHRGRWQRGRVGRSPDRCGAAGRAL